MKYLVIDEQYRIYQTNVLSGYLRSQCRAGNLSIVRLSDMHGMNIASADEEWSPIQDIGRGFRVEAA